MKIIKHVLIYNHVQICLSLSSQSKELIAPQSMGAGWVFVHMKVESLVAKRPNDKKATHSRTHSPNHCNSPQYLPRAPKAADSLGWKESALLEQDVEVGFSVATPTWSSFSRDPAYHIDLSGKIDLPIDLQSQCLKSIWKRNIVLHFSCFFCLMTVYI